MLFIAYQTTKNKRVKFNYLNQLSSKKRKVSEIRTAQCNNILGLHCEYPNSNIAIAYLQNYITITVINTKTTTNTINNDDDDEINDDHN